MLGYPDPLKFAVADDKVSVAFPRMSRLMRECGRGCQWAYVIRAPAETLVDMENGEEETMEEEFEEEVRMKRLEKPIIWLGNESRKSNS